VICLSVKICKQCNQELPATEKYFYRKKDNRDGLTNLCRKCNIQRTQKYWKANLERKSDYDKQIYQENKRKRNQQHLRIQRDRNEILTNKIGISYDKLHRRMKQKVKKPKVCTICNEKRQLEICCIDHNYNQNPNSWIWLCLKCHRLFDKCRKKIPREKVIIKYEGC